MAQFARNSQILHTNYVCDDSFVMYFVSAGILDRRDAAVPSFDIPAGTFVQPPNIDQPTFAQRTCALSFTGTGAP